MGEENKVENIKNMIDTGAISSYIKEGYSMCG